MKKKIATVWLGGCSGCHMSFLDMDERILDIAAKADVVKSPLVDGKEFPDVDIVLIEGAAAADEHREELKKIRARSRILVSLGDCAVTGNVTALRNFFPVKDVLDRSYLSAESNVDGKKPGDEILPGLLEKAVPLHEVVAVDYFIPGCPPSADLIHSVLDDLLEGRVPHIPSPKNG